MTVVADRAHKRTASRSPSPVVSTGRALVAGVVAAGVALAATELVGVVGGSGPTLVTAVGTHFIDETAGALKDFAVSVFGTNDKPALITGIIIFSLLFGALLGRASMSRRWIGGVGFAVFGFVGMVAGLTTPLTSSTAIVLASVLGTVAGITTLYGLLAVASPRAPASTRPEDPRVRTATRRTFLTAAGGAGALALLSTGLSRVVRDRRTVTRGRTDVALPAARSVVAAPQTQPFTVDGLSPYITPSKSFYRIDTALFVPHVDAADWKLAIRGMVDHPVTFTLDDLLAMDLVEEPITIACVSNEVGGDLIGTAIWRGVPLSKLLDRAGVQPGATQIVGRSVDEFTVGFPTEKALDGRTALVAVGMNGEPLPVKHGFPARLIVAGLYGYVSATKWVKEIELTRLEDFDAYWIPRGWAKEAPIKTESRIDVPRSGASLAAGPVRVAGVAWAPTRGIRAVEVRVDDDPWQQARLGEVASDNTWVQWVWEWPATAGSHFLTVRATDGDGRLQTSEHRPPAPDGAAGYHVRTVKVT